MSRSLTEKLLAVVSLLLLVAALVTVLSPRPPGPKAPGAAAASSERVLARSGAPVQWVSSTHTIVFDGLTRSYLVWRPSRVQPTPIPVLVELGGCCYGAAKEADRANFRPIAGPAVLVYPSYTDQNWDAGACCGSAAARHVDDAGFVAAVLAAVRSENSDASASTAYLAGYSNGAKLAMMVACQRPTLFSAVAVYGATRTSACNGPPAASVLIMAGSADPEASVSGPPVTQNGFTEPTVDQLAASYRTADGCRSTAQPDAVGTLQETVWGDCQRGLAVGVAVYEGHDHTWPQATATTPSAQQVMWDWFIRRRL